MTGSPSPTENDALAKAYNRALKLEKAGRREEAIAAWRDVLALDPPDHGGAAIRLAALGAIEPPRRMPDAYVTTLFDQHADAFDDILVAQLGYDVPSLLAQRLRELAPTFREGENPEFRFSRALDLGCGTGLAGEMLADLADVLIGLDLSEEMVALADEREVYDDLYIAEAEDFLENIGEEEAPFDLIVATDVLPYIGDVSRLFRGFRDKTNAGAVIGFSTEAIVVGDGQAGYGVLPTHRYGHDPAYLERELAAHGFEVVHCEDITVRMEKGVPAPGHLFLARKANVIAD